MSVKALLSGLVWAGVMCTLISLAISHDAAGKDPAPISSPLAKDGEQIMEDDGSTVTTATEKGTTKAPLQANKVKDLVEAITLAVTSGICGPSLFALIGCFIRQIRITWDDPFAGKERPVDEAAERKQRRMTLRQQSEADGAESADNYVVSRKATNNFDPMVLDGVTTLDLDKIRAKPFPNTTNNNPAGKVNKGYSKTLEDIM